MDAKLQSKLQKLLALTTSPMEGEAQAASHMLAKLLEAHNLDIADLERKGASRPGVRQQQHDLGKAAFKWKLRLAEAIAEHFYCMPLVDKRANTVSFIGRPDNVDALQLLYGWLIDQIRRIASIERRSRIAANPDDHMDPLRWQCGFGDGAAVRIGQRLREKRQQESTEAGSALAISHKSEISDYLEAHFGYRVDGKPTKSQAEAAKRYEAMQAKWDEERRIKDEWKARNPDDYYLTYPWEHPDEIAKEAAEREKQEIKRRKQEERNAKRRVGRSYVYESDADRRKRHERYVAHSSGRTAADNINLTPHLNEGEVRGRLTE